MTTPSISKSTPSSTILPSTLKLPTTSISSLNESDVPAHANSTHAEHLHPMSEPSSTMAHDQPTYGPTSEIEPQPPLAMARDDN
jgi:hypothetical protein